MSTRLHIPASRYYADAQKRKDARAHNFARRTYSDCGSFGAPWKREGREYSDGTRYCDAISDYFREVGNADEIVSIKHTGWYVNDFQETTRGIVLQLPARKGVPQYFAAYSDPNNDNAASVDLTESYDDRERAARAADSLAERYAELCREDNAKYQAEQDIETAAESIALVRAEHSELCAEMRRVQRMQFDLLNPSDIPPARLTDRAPNAICKALRKQLATLRAQVVDEIKTIRERRENPWSAISQ